MNLPITADNRVTQFILDLLARFQVFNSIMGCKIAELICICIVCIGTKAKKALKFNVKTMVVYPILAGLTLVALCFIFHAMSLGMSLWGFPASRLLYALCSVVGTMLVHQGLDGIAKYYNHSLGEDRFNFENESFQQSEVLAANDYSVNIPMVYYWQKRMRKGWINITNPFRDSRVLNETGMKWMAQRFNTNKTCCITNVYEKKSQTTAKMGGGMSSGCSGTSVVQWAKACPYVAQPGQLPLKPRLGGLLRLAVP